MLQHNIVGSVLYLGKTDLYEACDSFNGEFNLEGMVFDRKVFNIKKGEETLKVDSNSVNFSSPGKICFAPEDGLYKKLINYQKNSKASA